MKSAKSHKNRIDQGNPEHTRELQELVEVFRNTAPAFSRRDAMRWMAVASGAAIAGRGATALAAPGHESNTVASYQDEDVATDVEITVPFDPYGQPVTLDPHQTVNWGPFWVLFPNVWGGLLRYDENGAVQLDLAEDFSVSDDGLTYTFTIREDALFASGNPVTAEACVSSWLRALDPSRLSPMSEFMSRVDGYRQYVQGESDDIGFTAVDERTVEVRISKEYTYFPSLMAAFVWSVVDPVIVEEFGEDFVINGAGTGPWQFASIEPGTEIVMEPNTSHYGGNSPSITRIVWPLLSGPEAASTALEMYQSDEAISADVPLSLKSDVESDDTLSSELVLIAPEGTVSAIGMDFRQPPFGDVRVRRAIAQSIDKEAWANEIWEGTWTPGSSFTPPVLGLIANYEAPEGLPFDPQAAQDLLAEAGYESADDIPEIVYYQPLESSDSDKTRARLLLDMIQENSGISITHDTSLSRQQIADLQVDNGGRQFDIVGWWNLWETPHILNETCSPDSQHMRGVFNWDDDLEPSGDFDPGADADQFEEMVDDADFERDEAARNELFREAEDLLLQNAVYVPLGYWVQMYVQKPYLQGTKQGTWTGRLPVWFNSEVVVLNQE